MERVLGVSEFSEGPSHHSSCDSLSPECYRHVLGLPLGSTGTGGIRAEQRNTFFQQRYLPSCFTLEAPPKGLAQVLEEKRLWAYRRHIVKLPDPRPSHSPSRARPEAKAPKSVCSGRHLNNQI